MANVKISDLTPATTLQATDLLVIAQDNGVDYDTRSIPASILESAGKKRFISKIKQTSTFAPTITIKQDDFNDTYTTNYVGVGQYEIVGFNSELDDDCEISINIVILSAGHHIRTYWSSADTLVINTFDETDTLSNDIMNWDNLYITVTKYL